MAHYSIISRSTKLGTTWMSLDWWECTRSMPGTHWEPFSNKQCRQSTELWNGWPSETVCSVTDTRGKDRDFQVCKVCYAYCVYTRVCNWILILTTHRYMYIRCMIPFIGQFRKGRSVEPESRPVLVRGWEDTDSQWPAGTSFEAMVAHSLKIIKLYIYNGIANSKFYGWKFYFHKAVLKKAMAFTLIQRSDSV